MRYAPIDPQLFVENRARLKQLLPPRALALLNANDVLPTNADGTMAFVQNSDLFYLSGVDQEETVLILFPNAADEKNREILFLRETSEDIAIWEGHKLTKDEARARTGIKQVRWLSEFPNFLRTLMCEAEQIFLNTNEHKRAHIEVENRDSRFIRRLREDFPLHDYRRLAPLMHRLRAVKSAFEIELIRKACTLTGRGFERLLKFVRPGVNEVEVEAELAHEFIRGGGGFAYGPIIASGPNACVLHYVDNDQICEKGHLLLLDVAASYANYRSDLTRTIPVSGRFSKRQREVYDAVLRVMRASIQLAVPGKLPRDWQKESEALMEKELLALGLITKSEIRKQDPDRPALKKYFMHGIGHPLGLDVHDVADITTPIQAGWVLTVEPGIYIKEEGLAVRLENDIVVGESGPTDLMADIPIEAKDIEKLMRPALLTARIIFRAKRRLRRRSHWPLFRSSRTRPPSPRKAVNPLASPAIYPSAKASTACHRPNTPR